MNNGKPKGVLKFAATGDNGDKIWKKRFRRLKAE